MNNEKSDIRDLSLDKFINYVESVKHLDEESGGQKFKDAQVYIEDALHFYNKNRSNSVSIIEFAEMLDEKENEILMQVNESTHAKVSSRNKKENNLLNEKFILKFKDYYAFLGDVLDKNGILDEQTKRNNLFWERNGLPELKVSKQVALKEFKENREDSIPLLYMRAAYTLNKLTKYIYYELYAQMQIQDENNSKTSNFKRVYYMSKLKTDFLMKFLQSELMGVDIIEEKIEEYQKEYEKMFGEVFDNLNLEEDLEKTLPYCDFIDNTYFAKEGFGAVSVAEILNGSRLCNCLNKIKKWGFKKEKDGGLALAVHIRNYPTPISIHVSTSGKFLLGFLKYISSRNIKVPEYDPVYLSNGKMIKSNLLYELNGDQRAVIKQKYKDNPNNKLYEFLYSQTSDAYKMPPQNEIKFNDLLR